MKVSSKIYSENCWIYLIGTISQVTEVLQQMKKWLGSVKLAEQEAEAT
jgi:hypothetical protein